MKRHVVWTGSLIAALAAAPALADPPADIADLVGARAAGGETQMEARGYAHQRTTTVRGSKWSFWWNERRGQCASVATTDGRYATIEAVPPGNCDRDGAAAPAMAARPPEDHLMLICWGEGKKPSTQYRSGYEWNSRTHKYERSSSIESTTADYEAELLVEITGRQGRIKPAKELVPPIHSGGSDGWWDLQELRVDPRQISGRFSLNGLNKPRLTIDRRIGRITVQGMQTFHGTCEDAVRAADNPRF